MLLKNSHVFDVFCTAAGDVDTASVELGSPSPAKLSALTANTYSCPPERPLTLQANAVEPLASQATVESNAPPAPSLRYTMYPVTADPVDATGADHTRSMPSVCDAIFNSPVGAAGLVDTATAALRSPSPAELTALTTYVYSTPPDRPDSTVLTPVLPRPSNTNVSNLRGPGLQGGQKYVFVAAQELALFLARGDTSPEQGVGQLHIPTKVVAA